MGKSLTFSNIRTSKSLKRPTPAITVTCSTIHYEYNQATGRKKFTDDVNRIFERNGIAYELKNGEIIRFTSAVLHESLATAAFKTGDAILDSLLETAR
jgi:hypothetical protein